MTTLHSILSTRLAYNELLSRLEEYVRVKEREAAERAYRAGFRYGRADGADTLQYMDESEFETFKQHLKQYEK